MHMPIAFTIILLIMYKDNKILVANSLVDITPMEAMDTN